MSDEAGAAAEPPTDETADEEGDDEGPVYAPGLSDDGILLFFAGVACLLAATTATLQSQPRYVAVFAVVAGLPAMLAFFADVLSGYVPSMRVHLFVGAAAFVGAGFAIPGRHYTNLGTLGVAAALVLWRVFDVEVRGTER
ncbi:MAG: hypothetical protein ACI8UR_001773 [Natronomonas sp.]|jgi:hypothetical protein|uniref:hypothetical protein n=1 Tax=Natronomonas sp. TaxID=2184060 RepID=UPI00398A4958